MLRIENLQKVYGSGDEALKGVSFTVEGENLVSIIGPSGAGKSTLVHCINRLTEPTDGHVHLDGTDLTELGKDDLRDVRRDIGMVFQEYALVERLTVMENVLSGRLGYTSRWQSFRRSFDSSDIRRAYELLDQVGLAGHQDDRADELSGGAASARRDYPRSHAAPEAAAGRRANQQPRPEDISYRA
jgi:phosphonate transport system ATP-binding protein